MAEAAEATQHRFFCHCCKRETNPKLPDLVCPRCDSGFIEEVTEESSLLQDSTSSASEDSDSLFSEGPVQMTASRCLQVRPALFRCHRLLLRPQNQSLHPGLSRRGRPGLSKGLQWKGVFTWIVQQVLADIFANNGNPGAAPAALSSMLQLYANPADYAWGQGGLDAVITELLGQLEGSGPPPAEKDMISSLPSVCISKEQKDCRLECPVCREEYSFGESVRKLPCLHYFHSHCIVPWLELHDTCPVCRKSLDGVDNSLPSTAQPAGDRAIRAEQQERQAI
ncbi:E3 ubiquitin-protein ligase RNF115 isoform X2 [Solea solea]|uniref:E3 ubiquitin-protein ligase RNF115 isoform X2 n=1 Tax=Solea solea TaxID=90069 RepID=UPI00272CE587|nr:E3 ubiquitin-protein ligase RNF115 isoform X2 [Solea solea]